jgi:L-ascorbate metabolism protein UlaG (beta-lactamase superfamily)
MIYHLVLCPLTPPTGRGLQGTVRPTEAPKEIIIEAVLQKMIRKKFFWHLALLLGGMFLWASLVPSQAHTACRNPNIATDGELSLRPVAASGSVEIKWFGHAFFQIASSAGTRVITDPFGNMGYPMPEVWPHVVTVGRESGNHNNVALAKGEPLVLRGQNLGTNEWNQVNTTFRDVLIYNVPIHTRGIPGYFKGSAFVFEMDGLCICHTGDVGEPFNEDQLELIGHVDIVLLPVGGAYTMGPENAKKVTEQLKPKIAVPMHYYSNFSLLERYIDGPYRVRRLETNRFTVSKDTLPPVTEIYVPIVLWHGDL